jgi:3-methylfumaryl-CoA hydratase
MAQDEFKDWIGRSVTRRDVVTERIVEQFRATFSPYLFDAPCPPGLHWCLAVPVHPPENLGPDGAERKGLFLPPIDLSKRMWAGGCVETFGSFQSGDMAERLSRIADIKWRNGTSGKLCIVSVIHEFRARSSLVVRERHDLLFRDGGIARQLPEAEQMPPGELRWKVEASPLLLFRFSALTFNGHRIHYDLPHARDVEGYDGLLVHGPLQATLMLNQFSVVQGEVPQRFDYRCVAPLVAGQTFSVMCDKTQGRIVNATGVTTFEATAQ